ncbi:branched-chain alpha-keto acid dehydrogenase subunit E2 [Hahella sp. CCB-MM4]|uniref:dihydrolipoamide acetyltransferase family protein n=1 Tax=Hahella sp. (strain CCB-MM4) TaxID=1926491 RepID=UPI000B9ACF73|nr:dihydrolipoamide acetyltransferase family protein [Hahella sp. CCB-MM4]OZG74612.1 branched-chain alpha-keto acid dehydrogenase subunit E2 [Hahella sp. CCB-MM4]
MKFFKLPDLGEGLAEAEIVAWHVKEGDEVKTDQLLVSVETAKAIVEVPSPQNGTIAALFGDAGDVIHVGEPLVEFQGAGEDTGTVVGELKRATSITEDHFIIGAASQQSSSHRARATPAVRALAKRLGVDLNLVKPSQGDVISALDVEKAAEMQSSFGEAEPLRGVRRTMARNMAKSHAEVVPVSLYDDADIHDWPGDTDITMRLVHAIAGACQASPALNAWFDGHGPSRRLFEAVHIGIAVDSEDGLFVPVLRDVNTRKLNDLRKGLNAMRADIKARKIPPQEMQGATITLSNFGTMAGRYASPIVVPPQVAIIGAGVIREEVVAKNGEMQIRRRLPLSLTFDHRAATGGEAARFLAAMVKDLERATLS